MTAPRCRSPMPSAPHFEAEGRKPHWRFKLSHNKVAWDDLIRGPVEIDTATLSDPVLIREDGRFLYTMSVGGGRCGVRHQPHPARRGPCHQHRAADRDLRGAGRARAALSPITPCSRRRAARSCPSAKARRRCAPCAPTASSRMALNAYLARIGTSDAIEPALTLAGIGRRFRLREDGPGAGAFRACPNCSRSTPRPCMPCPMRRWRSRVARQRSGLGCGQAQCGAPPRCRGAGANGDRPGHARDRGCRPDGKGPGAAAARALGRRHLGRLDQGGGGGNRRQGPGAVSSLAAGPDRPSLWTRNSKNCYP